MNILSIINSYLYLTYNKGKNSGQKQNHQSLNFLQIEYIEYYRRWRMVEKS